MKDQMPSFTYERFYWRRGMVYLAGIDEVGMGALAGPVVAGAVVFEGEISLPTRLIRDSKQLSPAERERAADWIKQHARAWAIGEASVDEIAQLNIRQASHLAMRRAIAALPVTPAALLVDGHPVQLHSTTPTHAIVRGDQLCFSIAAASIVAKVHRDRLMEQFDQELPHYGFARHKGYGTVMHLQALKQHGVSVHHRLAYAPIAALLTSQEHAID